MNESLPGLWSNFNLFRTPFTIFRKLTCEAETSNKEITSCPVSMTIHSEEVGENFKCDRKSFHLGTRVRKSVFSSESSMTETTFNCIDEWELSMRDKFNLEVMQTRQVCPSSPAWPVRALLLFIPLEGPKKCHGTWNGCRDTFLHLNHHSYFLV